MYRVITRIDGNVEHTEDHASIGLARYDMATTVDMGVIQFAETEAELVAAHALRAEAANAVPGTVVRCPRNAELELVEVQA